MMEERKFIKECKRMLRSDEKINQEIYETIRRAKENARIMPSLNRYLNKKLN
jgi:hypothetical protein